MLPCFISATAATQARPIYGLTTERLTDWLTTQTDFVRCWVKTQGFTARPDSVCLVPDETGEIAAVLLGQAHDQDVWVMGGLPGRLPEGSYCLHQWQPLAALAWGMGAYQFTRYKPARRNPCQLVLPAEVDSAALLAELKAIYTVRDLINTPTEDMGPAQLAAAAAAIAAEYGAQYQELVGDQLLTANYLLIHAVGRASQQSPRLVDLHWGDPQAPRVTLVGKGVCFDSGGLDIKPASGMALMKKDMGGAAQVLGLAMLIMQAKLPIRLRVLIPAVENAVSGNAYRPGDVLPSRKGLSVEVTNTDAEGRLVLADALTEAASENPHLIIAMATLTGAARVAVGTDIAAFFTDDENLAAALSQIGNEIADPVWRLPLFTPYRKLLDSSIADLNNSSASPYAGAITAALFLKEFVPPPLRWVHFDLMAWNTSTRPGHPEGGEAMAIRTLFAYLQQQFPVP